MYICKFHMNMENKYFCLLFKVNILKGLTCQSLNTPILPEAKMYLMDLFIQQIMIKEYEIQSSLIAMYKLEHCI